MELKTKIKKKEIKKIKYNFSDQKSWILQVLKIMLLSALKMVMSLFKNVVKKDKANKNFRIFTENN
jgi:hypothetical protein